MRDSRICFHQIHVGDEAVHCIQLLRYNRRKRRRRRETIHQPFTPKRDIAHLMVLPCPQEIQKRTAASPPCKAFAAPANTMATKPTNDFTFISSSHFRIGLDFWNQHHDLGLRVFPPDIAGHPNHVRLVEGMNEGRESLPSILKKK